LIFYREISNSTLKDAQSFAGMEFNVFANIPTVDETRKGYHVLQGFLEEPSSTFSESFRNIRTYTQKIFPNKNSFLITSSDPGEGKTTVAFNFALSLEKNSQVLIIEADIRKPSVLNHYYSFHDSAEEELGLSDIMDNKAILSDTIQKVPGTNLDLITSGKKRYDLSDLVTVDQLRALVKTLQKKYDYIIIDSAPINPVTDTLILSQVIDCIFFVVRSEKTKVLAFLSAIKKLKDIQIDVSGIIINDIDVTKYSYYDYYSQNYYYGPKMDPQQT
jgi:capsular exopolysaccharide synthesis family protein